MNLKIAALALSAALAPLAAVAAPISSYPAASTPLSGSETVIGTQSATTVQITTASIAALLKSSANTYTQTQTFADGGSWGSGGISGLTALGTTASACHTWASQALAICGGGGSAGLSEIQFKEGSTKYASLYENTGVGEFVVDGLGGYFWATAGGGFANGALTETAAGTFALGNGSSFTDTSGSLTLANLTATHRITTPDGGTFTTTADNVGSYLNFVNFGFHDPTTGVPGGSQGVISPGWTAGTGLNFIGEPLVGGGWFQPYAFQTQGWDLQFFNSQGYQIFGIEHAAEDNHSLQLGASRGCSAMYTNCGPSQLLFTDVLGNGIVTSLGTITPGSGYVNGTYTNVLMTGGTGGDLYLNITVSGGAVTAATLTTHAGGGFTVGDVLTTSNANLGGSGSGFQITVAAVTSGTITGPVILMQGPLNFIGFGQGLLGATAAGNENAIRFGASGNTGTAWDNSGCPQACPNLAMTGAVRFATLPGNAFTEQAEIKAATGGLQITQPNSATFAPISVSFERQNAVTLSALNTADPSPAPGDRATITDATSCTFGSAVTGGGSTKCPVVYLGSWVGG